MTASWREAELNQRWSRLVLKAVPGHKPIFVLSTFWRANYSHCVLNRQTTQGERRNKGSFVITDRLGVSYTDFVNIKLFSGPDK